MQSHESLRRRGFTLIELLVVVAIIALLISILLPSLAQAREMGKVAKCMANFKNLTTAATAYFMDYKDGFPLTVNVYAGGSAVSMFGFAGASCSQRWYDGFNDAGNPVPAGAFAVEVQNRPFNPYLVGTTPDLDIRVGNQIQQRTELTMMRCPSDTFSNASRHSANPNPHPQPAYVDVGTSYMYNLLGIRWAQRFHGGWRFFEQVPQGTSAEAWWNEFARAMTRSALARHASTFTMFVEDPMLYNLLVLQGGMGYHGKFSRHVMGYLDGHATYGVVDTRGYCGPGWTSINPDWISIFGQTSPSPFRYSPVTPSATPSAGGTGARFTCNPPR